MIEDQDVEEEDGRDVGEVEAGKTKNSKDGGEEREKV